MQNFSRLLERLADSGVDFVIIGGFAALTHGSSFMTRDVDVCADLNPENISRLREALKDWNPRHRMTPQRLSFLDHPPVGQCVNNLYIETDYGVLDLLSHVMGLGDFSRLQSGAEIVEVDGREYAVIGLPDLITAKEAVARDKDLLVAKELRAIAVKRGMDIPPPSSDS
ncbi:nucleotidyltransferase [Opitutaceae bacterium]|nr:nucleotidyltransferase [Opitutaceae bacterium]